MDLTESIAPKTDQQNFDDYLLGPRTVTVSEVKKGNPEQPVNVELKEYPGKPYKPNKSMRRVLVAAWGTDSSAYIGRRLTLVGNPKVVYGGKAVGGIEISAMSNLAKPLTLALTETRGKKRTYTVQPLPDAPTPPKPPTDAQTVNWRGLADQAKGNEDELRALWMDASASGVNPDTLDYIRKQAEEPSA